MKARMAVGIATGYSLDDQGWFLVGAGNFLFDSVSRLALGPTQLPIQWYWGLLWGVSGWGMKLTTHLQLVPRLRMHGAMLPLPQHIFMAWYLV